MMAALLALWRMLLLTVALFAVTPASAQTCNQATSQGTAPSSWLSYCWLDMSTYSDTTARTTAGQTMVFTLTDGSTLSLNVRVTPTAGAAYSAVASPSWTGASMGNVAFIGIPGRPVLYTLAGGTRTIEIRNITITPPAGAGAATAYSFVVADAESTNESESLTYTTNGGSWQILDQVPPITGGAYPTVSGAGTSTFTVTGATGTVGAFIAGTNSPTTVTVRTVAGGLEGVMFAVRFASLRLTKTIAGARVNAADQFTFRIATSGGTTLSSGTTTGSGLGSFATASANVASGLQMVVSESMAAGSASAITAYQARLTCTNGATGSSTSLPTDAAVTSYTLPALQFGDSVLCTFTNTPQPHLRVRKALASAGRAYAGDQFTMRIMQGSTVVATSTSTGAGSTVTAGDTGLTQVTAGTAYSLEEQAAGTTDFAQYTPSMSCANANSTSTTVLPSAAPGSITPVVGDVITCTITNTFKNLAILTIDKSSTLLSDPVNGTVNPKLIPGAIVEYAITVTNVGARAVDASSVVLTDPLPADLTYDNVTGVSFSNGTTPSGLNAFNPATMVTYSSQSGGGAPYNYTPSGSYDANVRGLRIAPTGTMAAATATTTPSFTIRFRARVN